MDGGALPTMRPNLPISPAALATLVAVCLVLMIDSVAALALPKSGRSVRPEQILLCDAPRGVMPKLTDRYADRAVLHNLAADDEGVAARLERGDLDAFVVRSANSVSADMVRRLPPRVRAIGRAGVGCDNIDLVACEEAGIPVATAAGANAAAVAEHALALMLALARRIEPAARSVAEGRWEKASLTGIGLRGRTVGVVGFGAVGAEVAALCAALGMRVLVAPPTEGSLSSSSAEAAALRERRMARSGAEDAAGLDELLRASDFVAVHLPLTDATRGYIGQEQLAEMRPGAMLISAGRGGVVDEAALLDSLESGRIAGAALDVFESEGPGLSEDAVLMKLAALDSTIITPHIGGHTAEAQSDVWCCVLDRLLATLEEQSERR